MEGTDESVEILFFGGIFLSWLPAPRQSRGHVLGFCLSGSLLWTTSRLSCGHVGLLRHLVLLLLVPVVCLAFLHLAHLALFNLSESSCVDRPKAGSRRRFVAWVLGPSLTPM